MSKDFFYGAVLFFLQKKVYSQNFVDIQTSHPHVCQQSLSQPVTIHLLLHMHFKPVRPCYKLMMYF